MLLVICIAVLSLDCSSYDLVTPVASDFMITDRSHSVSPYQMNGAPSSFVNSTIDVLEMNDRGMKRKRDQILQIKYAKYSKICSTIDQILGVYMEWHNR